MRIWKAREVKLKVALNTKNKNCVKFNSSQSLASRQLLTLCYIAIFLWIRKSFFLRVVRKKGKMDWKSWSSAERQNFLWEIMIEEEKLSFWAIVKNYIVIHYEKLKIIYQVHVEIFVCCCAEGFFGLHELKFEVLRFNVHTKKDKTGICVNFTSQRNLKVFVRKKINFIRRFESYKMFKKYSILAIFGSISFFLFLKSCSIFLNVRSFHKLKKPLKEEQTLEKLIFCSI